MKRKITLMAVAALMTLESCTIQSLHPIYDEESLIFKQELIGVWEDGEGGIYYLESTFQNKEKPLDNINLKQEGYLLKIYIKEGGSSWIERRVDGDSLNWIKMRLHIVEIQETVFWNLFPQKNYEDNVSGVLTENLLPVHIFGKVEIEDNELKIYSFKLEWLGDLFQKNQVRIPHENVITPNGSTVVLTASTKELQKFVVKYQNETKAFEEPLVLKRVRN